VSTLRQISFLILFVMAGITMTGSSSAEPLSELVRNNLDGSQTLMGHVPLEVKNSKATKKFHALSSQYMKAKIILPLQNTNQLSALLKDLYDSKSPNFHHFLTPPQFAQQFGSSTIDSKAIQDFLNKQGISVTGQSPNGNVLDVTGPIAAFEQAFGLHINNYQKTDGTTFFAPDADPTIPPTLAGKILAIGGLDNLPKYHPHYHQVQVNTRAQAAVGTAAIGTGPGGYLAPGDVKTAYNLNSIPANGTGQNVALFELDGYSSSDVLTYDAQFGIPNVPLQNVLIDGFNGLPSGSGGEVEVTLDIELVSAIAPGSKNILVYEAPNTFSGWEDEWTRIASDNTAKVISCSWGLPEQDSSTLNFDNGIFQQMAAQGQAVFVASGDSGAFDAGGSSLSVDEPADQPNVTAVGISALSINTDRTYNSERASFYGGGGISADWTIPSYQTTVASQAASAALVSTTLRNMPDVVLTADPSTAYAFYTNGSWGGWWGSSLSAPIWASFMSCVNQWISQNSPLGFANPLLYQLAQTSNYASDFHDIITGNNQYYPAEPGFDDATGLGSFNGLNLFNDLVNRFSSIPLAPLDFTASAGNAQVVLSWNSSIGATSYNLERAIDSNGPYTTIAPSLTNNNYIDNSVSNGITYYYVVTAVNSAGQSANSTQASASPSALLPTTPTGLQAFARNAQVLMLWNASTGATSYNIKRATISGGPYTIIGSSVDPNYNDNSVSNGTTYYYVVSAVNSSGEGLSSTQVSVTPLAPPLAPLGVSANGSNDSVLIEWNIPSQAASFLIKRSTVSGGPYVVVGTQVVPNNYFYDNSVSNGTTYYYVVSAVNSSGEGPNSAQVSATPLPPPSIPVLTASAGNAQVVLSWTASSGATLYIIARSTINNGQFSQIATQLTNAPYTDTSVVNGTTYYYLVQAENADSDLADSNIVSATPMAPLASPTIITQPVNTTVTAPARATFTVIAKGNPSPTYQWQQETPGASTYTAIFGAIGASYTTPATTTANSGTQYECVVSNSQGSITSNAAILTVNPLLPPSAPVGFQAQGGNSSVYLTWVYNPGLSYNVKKSTVNGGPYTTISSGSGNYYYDVSVGNGTTYYYVVSAVNSAGEGPNSTQVSATPLAPPTEPILSATPGNAQVTLSWTASTGLNVYYLYKNDAVGVGTSGVNGTLIYTSSSNAPYTDTAVKNGTTYNYQVIAENADNEAADSNTVNVTPQTPPTISTITNQTINEDAATGALSFTVGDMVTPAGNLTLSAASSNSALLPVSNIVFGGSGANRTVTITPALNQTGTSTVTTTVTDAVGLTATTSFTLTVNPISPDGAYIFASTGGSLVSSAGTWTFGTATGPGGNVILLNGAQAGNITAYFLLVYNKGQVYAYDTQRQWYLWNGVGWVTQSGDPYPPEHIVSVPTNLAANAVSASQINLTWGASTDSAGGVTGYKIFRNGTQVGTSTSVSYSDTGLTSSTTYSYTVSAYDSVGNNSAQSSTVSAQTLPLVPVDNSSCVSIVAPASVTANQNFSATVTMLNTGNTTWDPATNYRLGSQDPRDNSTWGLGRVFLNSPVTAGNSVAITVNATAPATPGTYAFDWKMLQESVQWFGATCTSTITVNSPVASTYAITASAGSNGTISPSGVITVNSGANQTFTVTPNAGYTANLTVDGNTVTLTNNSYTLINVIAPHTVTASFTPIQSPGDNSSCVSIVAPASVNAGQNFSATVTMLNTGSTVWDTAVYHLGSQDPRDNITWGLGRAVFNNAINPGSTVVMTFSATAPSTPGTYSFDWEMVHEWVQWFGPKCTSTITVNTPVASTYAITASAGSGGTISPSGVINVNSGANQTFTLTPNEGYTANLTVDGNTVTLTNNSYTLINVTAPHTVTASFTPIQSPGDNSSCVSIVAPASVTANQSFSATVTMLNTGSTVWDTAVYHLGSQDPRDNITWGLGRAVFNNAINPGSTVVMTFSATAPSTPGTYSFDWEMVHEWVQWFGPKCTSTITVNTPVASTYAITASAGSGGTISPSGVINVNSGANQTFTLTPNEGYTANLTVDGNEVSLTNNTYTLTNVTSNHTVTASFTPIQSPGDNSSCVSIVAPASVNAGQNFSATVTMLNTGSTVWDTAVYHLGSQDPRDNVTWGLGRVVFNDAVNPGSTVLMTFSATAPSTPGTYSFDWEMVHEWVQWFGPKCTSTITVNSAPASN